MQGLSLMLGRSELCWDLVGYGVSGLRLEAVDEWCEDLVWG